MKLLHIAVLATVIIATVGFPTPQDAIVEKASEDKPAAPAIEEKPTAEVKASEQVASADGAKEKMMKIEIHLEIKDVPADMKIPAVVQVTETEEPLGAARTIAVEEEKKVEQPTNKEVVKTLEKDEPAKAEEVKTVPEVEPKPVEVVNEKSEVKPEETPKTTTVEEKTEQKPELRAVAPETEQKKEVKEVEKEIATKPVVIEASESAKKIVENVEEPKTEIVAEKKLPATEPKQEDKPVAEEKKQEISSVIPASVTKHAVPIIEDLDKVSKILESEPSYRTIPVAVVQDETEKEKESSVTINDDDKVEKVKAAAKTVAEPKVVEVVKTEEEPAVKVVAEKTVETEATKDDTVVVKSTDPEPSTRNVDIAAEKPVVAVVPAADSVKAQEILPAKAAEEKPVSTSEVKEEPKVFVVEAKSVVENTKTVKATDEPVAEVKSVEPKSADTVKVEEAAKVEGSSTKTEDVKSAQKETNDKSDGDSSAAKSSEELKKSPEADEKVEDSVTGEQAPVPAKLEGKKGKKKLPGSNKKQNTI